MGALIEQGEKFRQIYNQTGQAQVGASAVTDYKRGLLGAATMGTSEIPTGGGIYGDETVADTLFSKEINDLALDGRSASRAAKDKAEADAKAGLDGQRPQALNLADEQLMAARKSARLRAAMGYGRTSTFLTGPAGDTRVPSLGRKSLLGG